MCTFIMEVNWNQADRVTVIFEFDPRQMNRDNVNGAIRVLSENSSDRRVIYHNQEPDLAAGNNVEAMVQQLNNIENEALPLLRLKPDELSPMKKGDYCGFPGQAEKYVIQEVKNESVLIFLNGDFKYVPIKDVILTSKQGED